MQVFLCAKTDGCRLDAHWKVFGDDGDVEAFVVEVGRYRKDSRVIVTKLETGGKDALVNVIEFDPQCSFVANLNWEVQSLVLVAKLV